MKKFEQLIWTTIVVLGIAIAMLVWKINPLISIPLVFMCGLLIYNGFFLIESNPPKIAIITFFGKRMFEKVLTEGWNWLFLLGYVNDYLLIGNHSREKKIQCNDVLTPDTQDLKVKIGLSYIVDEENIKNYLIKDPGTNKNNIREIDHASIDVEIEKALQSLIGNILRQWALHPIYGPHYWEEAVALPLEALNNIAKALFGENLEGIESEIPTSVLIQYFNNNKPSNNYLAKEYGENWEKLKEMLAEKHPNMNPEDSNSETKLQERVFDRVQILRRLESGKAKRKLESLGIIITRLNIEEILPNEENPVYKSSLEKAMEDRDRISEKTELETEIILADILAKEKEKHGMNWQECLKYVKDRKLVKAGKGHVDIKEINISEGTAKIILNLLEMIKSK